MSSTFVDDARDRAFERLYARHVREIYRYVLAVLHNPAEAEDVTQTTFLNAYRAIQAGAEPQLPQNWLIAIAHNACRSRIRVAMRRPREVSLDEVAELALPEPERLNVRELLRAFGRLPSNQRAALALREFEGRSYPEIAETLGVTVPAVESLIGRARKTLRRQSAALRGVVALLPRAGGIGTGPVAKVAAVLVIGVAAGSAGPPATGKTRPHSATPIHAFSVPSLPRHATVHRHVVPQVRRVRPVTVARPAPEVIPPAAAAPGAAPAAPPGTEPATAPSTPAGPPLPVPDQHVALPQLPDPPVQLPQLPAPPQLPPLPPLVAQVFPTSGI